jgi:hypothetical protein
MKNLAIAKNVRFALTARTRKNAVTGEPFLPPQKTIVKH